MEKTEKTGTIDSGEQAKDSPCGFIKVTKDNAGKDRGFIAIDAICSAFENSKDGNVSIMTMDGFWYDVVDDIEKIWRMVSGEETRPIPKNEYFKKKKMIPAGSETTPRKHTRGAFEVDKPKKPRLSKDNDLPIGVGEGQNRNKVDDTLVSDTKER